MESQIPAHPPPALKKAAGSRRVRSKPGRRHIPSLIPVPSCVILGTGTGNTDLKEWVDLERAWMYCR